MFIKFIVSVFYIFAFASSHVFTHKGGCRFEVDVDSEFFPLITNQNGILYPKLDPDDSKWYLDMRQGSSFHADCSAKNNRLKLFRQSQISAECVLNNVIRTSEGYQSFNEICKLALTTTVFRNGTCYNGYTKVEIVIMSATDPYSIVTVCHDEETDHTFWAKSYIRGADLDDSEPIKNDPSFKEANFYSKINANTCYTRPGQIKTVTELLGSAELTGKYIQASKNLFMARGHLTPSGDPIYLYEKKATFYFINAHPQWQTINGGNWNILENKVRSYAEKFKTTVIVYTGTYGVTTLDDVNGNPVEIWLGRNLQGKLVKRLPCPHLTWKVIHDEKRGTGLAIIQVNNPWAIVQPKDILCDDICNQISWVTWNVRDVRLGYTYCCDVESFSKALPYAPNLGNLPFLDF